MGEKDAYVLGIDLLHWSVRIRLWGRDPLFKEVYEGLAWLCRWELELAIDRGLWVCKINIDFLDSVDR